MSFFSKTVDDYAARGSDLILKKYGEMRDNSQLEFHYQNLKDLLEEGLFILHMNNPGIEKNEAFQVDARSQANAIIKKAWQKFPREAASLRLKTVSSKWFSAYDKKNAYNKIIGAIKAINETDFSLGQPLLDRSNDATQASSKEIYMQSVIKKFKYFGAKDFNLK